MIERGTIFWGGAFSSRKREARHVEVSLKRYAQYEAVVVVNCIHKGCRNPSRLTLTEGWLVILEGWGHPDGPGRYDEGLPLAGASGTVVHGTRFPFRDPRWLADFSSFLDEYVSRSGAVIVADFRKHDFGAVVHRRERP